jgi:hypothetical protein
MLKNNSLSLCAAAAFFTAASAAQASAVTYFGQEQQPSRTVTGAPLTAHDAFVGGLTGVGSEGFEGIALLTNAQSGPVALSFAGSNPAVTASLSGEGQVSGGTIASARFNTTANGSHWWNVYGSFTLNFASAISAFGFYATDVGDFGGQISIDLLATDGTHTAFTTPNTVGSGNGSLLFWGFADDAQSYTQITFGNTQPVGAAAADYFGFDDMTIGHVQPACTVNCGPAPEPVPGSVPEPTSLALAGLGLFAAGLSFRQARRVR